MLGATLELILILANVGTALVLFAILKRQNEILALGVGNGLILGYLMHTEIIWELFLGIYLTVKGFKPAPIIAGGLRSEAGPLAPQPA
ncbi:MAG TPA: hypothetical protein VLB81_07570 [Gaiellales bacterium]|nr:hypothetical protein [Gaiellales bacterium]